MHSHKLVEAGPPCAQNIQSRCRPTHSPRNDQDIPDLRAPTPRDPFGSTDCRDRDRQDGAGVRVATDDGDTRLVQSLIHGNHVLNEKLGRHDEADEHSLGLGTHRSKIAEINRGRFVAKVVPRGPLRPEVNAVDQRVLRDDDPVAEQRGIIGDALDKGAPFKLVKKTELPEIRDPLQRQAR